MNGKAKQTYLIPNCWVHWSSAVELSLREAEFLNHTVEIFSLFLRYKVGYAKHYPIPFSNI